MYDYNIQGKTELLAPFMSCITLKDHKENFLTNPKFRLICSVKSDLSKLKIILKTVYTLLEITYLLTYGQTQQNTHQFVF